MRVFDYSARSLLRGSMTRRSYVICHGDKLSWKYTGKTLTWQQPGAKQSNITIHIRIHIFETFFSFKGQAGRHTITGVIFFLAFSQLWHRFRTEGPFRTACCSISVLAQFVTTRAAVPSLFFRRTDCTLALRECAKFRE